MLFRLKSRYVIECDGFPWPSTSLRLNGARELPLFTTTVQPERSRRPRPGLTSWRDSPPRLPCVRPVPPHARPHDMSRPAPALPNRASPDAPAPSPPRPPPPRRPLAIDRHRHLPRRRESAECLVILRRRERLDPVGEADPQRLHQQPGAQRPAGIISVRGDERIGHQRSNFAVVLAATSSAVTPGAHSIRRKALS